ncbi:MAG: AtpZ/AtpI family protein [Actinomycetes bacterium]|jgi:F0F1-type ATP synthase assembly protein I
MSSQPEDEPKPATSQDPTDLPSVWAFVGMGTTIAGCVAVGVVVGLYVDGLARSAPWGLVVGFLLGSAAATASVVAQVRRYL